jgi:hypothetical protein
MAHTISQYFEIHRSKKAILLLVQPELNRKQIKEEEKMYIKIKGAQTTSRFERGDNKSADQIKAHKDQKDLEHFFSRYPDLEEEKL